MEIETKLILQISMFEGCNLSLIHNLQQVGLLTNPFEYCKCHITGEKIQYNEFANDALHSIHGKSKFQVGHLKPRANALKFLVLLSKICFSC